MIKLTSPGMPDFLPQERPIKDYRHMCEIYQRIQSLDPSFSKFDPEERLIYKTKINLIDFINSRAPNFLVLLCRGSIKQFTLERILETINNLKIEQITFFEFPIHNIYVFENGEFVFVKKNMDLIIDVTEESFTDIFRMKMRLSKTIGKCLRYTNKYRSDACKEDSIHASHLQAPNFNDEINQVHSGKNSEIYTNILFGESVALKFYKRITIELSKNMLFHEYNILVNLAHENIIRAVSLVQFDHDQWALAYENCSGGKLNPGEVREVSFHMKQAAQGLQYMHSKGVLHLNLQPQNLLLLPKVYPISDENYRSLPRNIIKICDFKLANKPPEIPFEDFINLNYIPPEQFMNKMCGTPTDIWSFGTVLYKLFTNQEPFRNEDHSIYNEVVIVKKLRPDIPQHFAQQFNSLYALIQDITNYEYEHRRSIESIIHALG